MKYQWGRKDPFTFATNSESWGTDHQRGKYPVKIYTIDGVLIYQDNLGGSNKDKQPVGGIIFSSIEATSVMETVKNPILFYNGNPFTVILHNGHTRDLWDYYWTSYSRGTDGNRSNPKWHNNYLSLYTTKHLKSIYDPCPYGYRISSNGTYNNFSAASGWVWGDYTGGGYWEVINIKSGFPATGCRHTSGLFLYTGVDNWYIASTSSSFNSSYVFEFGNTSKQYNYQDLARSVGSSVRCIEECVTNCQGLFFFVNKIVARPVG